MAIVKKPRQAVKRPNKSTGTQVVKAYSGKSRKSSSSSSRRRSSTSEQKKQRLESAEIVDMQNGSLQLAVNGRRSGPLIELNLKSAAELELELVEDKIGELCDMRNIDPGSKDNLKEVAKKAFVNYHVNNGGGGGGNGHDDDEDEQQQVRELDNLLDIELPSMDGQQVRVPATIASNSISYIVPCKGKVKCVNNRDDHSCKRDGEVEIGLTDYPAFADIPFHVRDRIFPAVCATQKNSGFDASCRLVVENVETTAIKRLRARPIVRNLLLSKDNNKLFDKSSGKEWKAIDIFLHMNNGFVTQPGKIVLLEGKVLADPKNARTSLMVNSAKELSEGAADIVEMNRLAAHFEGMMDPSTRMQWIISNFASYAHVINRENVIHAALLCHFSPLYLEFNAERIKGWMQIDIIGDSTVAKSKTTRAAVTELIGLGQMITGEMMSMAGLAAANTQSSSGQWMVEYGPLVLQDSKILAIDGAHKVSASDWATTGETQRDGILRVIKAAKAEANARTRLIAIFNPLSDDRRLTRAMDSFRYPVQSLETVQDATSIARADFCAFVSDDVGPEQVHVIQSNDYDEKIKCLIAICKHVWSGNYETVFTKEATQKILTEATRLYRKFNLPRIPLVSMDIDKKIARLSASMAAITCSFDEDWKTLTVGEKHVEYVVDLIEGEYEHAGLNAISAEERQELSKEEAAQILANIKKSLEKRAGTDDKFVHRIVNWLSTKSTFTRDELMEKFQLVEKDHLRPLISQLTDDRLVKRGSKGFSSLPKLIKLSRFIKPESSEKDQYEESYQKNSDNSANYANPKNHTPPPATNNCQLTLEESEEKEEKNESGGDIDFGLGIVGRVGKKQKQIGPKLLEHIRKHCPEREASTREWLQARGLLPEEDPSS
jgi:MCM P-loop domain